MSEDKATLKKMAESLRRLRKIQEAARAAAKEAKS